MKNPNDIPPQREPDRVDPVYPFAQERRVMIDDQLIPRDITSQTVLAAMQKIPRHLFVPPDLLDRAYQDSALPSADGQTISQPYIVAFMSQHIDARPNHTILEIGTGTGYQTAILATLVEPNGQIFTIERSPTLAESARALLDQLHIYNVHYYTGDGSQGWPSSPEIPAPSFDRILIAAATPQVPPPLLDQLKENGLLLAPLGPPNAQTLTLFQKSKNEITPTPLLECPFVPLLGQHAFPTDN